PVCGRQSALLDSSIRKAAERFRAGMENPLFSVRQIVSGRSTIAGSGSSLENAAKCQWPAQRFYITGRENLTSPQVLGQRGNTASEVKPCGAAVAAHRQHLLPDSNLPRDIREVSSGSGTERVPRPWPRVHIKQFVSIVAAIVLEFDLHNSVVLQ